MEEWNIPEQKINLQYHVKYNALDFPPTHAETEYQETLFLKDCAVYETHIHFMICLYIVNLTIHKFL